MKEGEISKSMGVDTKPAHRLEYKGHWILIDPKINEKYLGEIRMALNLGCGHCANEDESPFNEPCLSCTFFNNFQPKG